MRSAYTGFYQGHALLSLFIAIGNKNECGNQNKGYKDYNRKCDRCEHSECANLK
jgi:hypothetical protein